MAGDCKPTEERNLELSAEESRDGEEVWSTRATCGAYWPCEHVSETGWKVGEEFGSVLIKLDAMYAILTAMDHFVREELPYMATQQDGVEDILGCFGALADYVYAGRKTGLTDTRRRWLEVNVLGEWESGKRKWAGDEQEAVLGVIREVLHLWNQIHKGSGNWVNTGR